MRTAVFVLSVLLVFSLPAEAGGEVREERGTEDFSVRLSTGSPSQGEPVIVRATPPAGADGVVMIWKGREIPMRGDGRRGFLGLIGIDLLEQPGPAILSLRPVGGEGPSRVDVEIEVREGKFPVQELTLPEGMTRFDRKTLDRIGREARDLEQRFSRPPTPPAWTLPFVPPVAAYRPKGFGSRRIINGEPRSPHAGVDLNLPAGTPVTSIADGVVVFAGEQFFGGNSVVVDHGGGVFSVYYHLQRALVSEDQRVSRGETIGAVGSSGRATGPHLHFSVRAAGGRIDPSLLFSSPER